MLLSNLSEKYVCVNKNFRGLCKGVAVSLKSHAVRYLLCSSTSTQSATDFAVGVSAITDVNLYISLSRLRPARPGNCAKLTLGAPIYSFEGAYIGKLADLEMQDFIATKLFTDKGESFPITAVVACSDAVILRKTQPYPLGQRVPAPLISLVSEKSDGVITKNILKTAMQKSALVKLTLALPPFHFQEEY